MNEGRAAGGDGEVEWAELAEYRNQLQWVVDAGFLSPAEASLAADNIGAIVKLARRGIISPRLAGHLIETMGEKAAASFVARQSLAH